MPTRPSNNTLAHLLLLAVVMVWGATFVLVKDALQDASPLLFNLLRMTIAAAALMAVNHRLLRHITRKSLIAGTIVGIFLATGYQFQTAGLAHTTPAKSAFITSAGGSSLNSAQIVVANPFTIAESLSALKWQSPARISRRNHKFERHPSNLFSGVLNSAASPGACRAI